MRQRVRRISTIAFALALSAPIIITSPALAASTCVRHGTRLDVDIQASGFSTFILSRDSTGDIDLTEAQILGGNDIDCGDASVNNVDLIDVDGSPGPEDFDIRSEDGGFAPGATAEASPASSEIEIKVNLGAGDDLAAFTGTIGKDKIRMGERGLNLNGDGDGNDVVFDQSIELPILFGNDNDDVVTAGGGFSTGGAARVPLLLVGGLGDDRLTGGIAGDSITGQIGDDQLRGGGGNDRLGELPNPVAFGVANEDGKDDLNGGPGGDVLRGGDGKDRLKGAAQGDEEHGSGGNDIFRQLDKPDGGDLIFGGPGTDTASYASRTRLRGIKATLDGKRNDGGPGEKDSLGYKKDLENLTGGRGADRLIGNGDPNTLKGRRGDDFLNGRGGTDVCDGGPGTNTLTNCET